MSTEHFDCFRVQSNEHGEKATYSKSAYQPGDLVYRVQGQPSPQRTRDSIEVGPGEHVEDPYALYINHSFDPNLEVRGRKLIALTNIAEGDELTFNYLASESGIASPFVCHDTGQSVNSKACQEDQNS